MSAPAPSTSPPPTKPPVVTPGGELWGHPKGLFLLFMVEMWERFSYYGMRGLLVLYLVTVMSAQQTKPGVFTNTLALTQQIENPADKEKPIEKTARREHIVAAGQVPTPALAWNNPTELVFQELAANPSEDPKNPSDDWVVKGPETGKAHIVNVKDGKAESTTYALRVSNPTANPIKLVAQIEREKNPAGGEIATRTYFTVNDKPGSAVLTIQPDSSRKADDPTYDIVVKAHTEDSGRNWTNAEASNLYGWYTGFVYLLPIIGGLIADKLIGTHRSMVAGAILITLGHIVLGIAGDGDLAQNAQGMSTFVMGLALIIVGTGHFKPSVSVMVGQLYDLKDPRREGAFSVFYVGINTGAFLCNIVCGYLAVAKGWNWGFGAAAVGMILGLGTYLWGRPKYLAGIGEPLNTSRVGMWWIFLPVGIVLAGCVAFLFHIGMLAKMDVFLSNSYVVGAMMLGAIAYGVWFIMSQEPGDKGPVATIFIFMLFNAVFWLAFEQAGSSLNIFADVDTDRKLTSTTEIPTAWFQSVNALFIILFTPVMAIFWAKLAKMKVFVPQPSKIGLGLVFVGLGYVFMVWASMKLNTGLPKVGMFYICATYFLHTVGEIILSPTGLSYVAKTAPRKHVSSLMGIWFISSFIAGLGAGKVAALTEPIMEGKIKLPWNLGGKADFFLLFVITSIAAGIVMILVTPILRKFMRDPND